MCIYSEMRHGRVFLAMPARLHWLYIEQAGERGLGEWEWIPRGVSVLEKRGSQDWLRWGPPQGNGAGAVLMF